MSNPGLSIEQMQQAVDALADNHNNKTAAARALGLDRSTYRNRLEKADDLKFQPHVTPPKPRIRVPSRSVYTPTPETHGTATKLFVFGCSHDSPSIPDKSRFANAGRLASELRPDYIVDLGDAADFDSLSTHAIPGSQDDRDRPYFTAEIESLTQAVAAFHEHAPDPDSIPRYHLHGNHEHRLWRHEANNPASQGVFTTQLDQIYARFGWSIHAFREWLFLDGVGLTHAPITGMGREVSGQLADQTVARESTHSVIWSHTHKSMRVHKPKFGIGNAIDVFNTGCFMPQGYIKKYAGVAMTGWTYGVHLLTLREGLIESAKTWSELELQEMYN